MFDLRLPSGIFFAIVGLVLVVMGLTIHPQSPLTTANVDLYAGLVILGFGAFLLVMALRKTARASRMQ
jgi:uncharacterized membrane protein